MIAQGRRGHINVKRKAIGMARKNFSVKRYERLLGIDEKMPITLSPSDSDDTNEEQETLKDWYAYELKKKFHQARD